MGTCILTPSFNLDIARNIVRNNSLVIRVDFVLHTSETWLPLVLSQAGFFPSNGEVKRSRPDLWRDVIHGETIKLKWANIRIVKHSSVERSASE